MNKVILKGNLGKDPEVKTFDWGKVAKFSLATKETYKNREGEKVTETEWHNIVFKGAICNIIEGYVKKGQEVLVEGKIVTRTYKDKNQVDHWATEIVCHSFEFCGTKEKVENKEGTYQKSGKVDMKSLSDPAELDPSYEPPF